jgi:hypothetical protein
MACNVIAGTWKCGEKYIGVKTKEYIKMIASVMLEKIVFLEGFMTTFCLQ